MHQQKLKWLIVVLGFIGYCTLLSSGFTKIGIDGFSIHDDIAQALLLFRLDLTENVLMGEAFTVGDTLQAYFGLTPALLHLPLHFLLGNVHLSLVFCLLGFALCLVLFLRITQDLHPWIFFAGVVYLLYFAVGTSTYYENILWGINFAFAAILFFHRKDFYIAAFFFLLCMHARPTIGLGLFTFFMASQLFALKKPGRDGFSWGFIVAIVLAMSSYFLLNIFKFGLLSPSPMQHIQNSVNNIGLSQYSSPLYILRNAVIYIFSPGQYEQYFLRTSLTNWLQSWTAYRSSMQVTDELVYGLAWTPFFYLALLNYKKHYVALLPAAMGFLVVAAILLTFGGISQRYLLDAFPFIVLLLGTSYFVLSRFFYGFICLYSIAYIYLVYFARMHNSMAYLYILPS